MACDTFKSVAQNLAGLAAHIEATRRIDRYGGQKAAEIFKSFSVLPDPGKRTWRDILGLKCKVTIDQIKRRKRELAAQHHSDCGGNPDQLVEINAAADQALNETKGV